MSSATFLESEYGGICMTQTLGRRRPDGIGAMPLRLRGSPAASRPVVDRAGLSDAFGDERVDADRVHRDRLRLPFHLQLPLRLDGDAVVEALPRVLVDQDRPVQDLRVRLQAG